MLIPDKYRGGKVDSKVWTGVHFGYAPGNSYRAYVPELDCVLVSKDVTFIEMLYQLDTSVSISGKNIPRISDNSNASQEGEPSSKKKLMPWESGEYEQDESAEETLDATAVSNSSGESGVTN